jgi:hypothetical protein
MPSEPIEPLFKDGLCPFGAYVGNPPTVTRCPLGFPGCSCGDEMVRYLTEPDEQSARIVGWWEAHSDEF